MFYHYDNRKITVYYEKIKYYLNYYGSLIKCFKLSMLLSRYLSENIFLYHRDNPCQHPIVILKGIPFSEINLLVEFMYKGSVDVQELDLQSLMHTASELEIRGLAYEARDNAAQMLNVNLEYPSYPQTQTPVTATPQSFPQSRTDVERLKQVSDSVISALFFYKSVSISSAL